MPARLTVAQYLDYLRPFYPTWDRELERSILKELRLPPDRRIGDPLAWNAHEDVVGLRAAVSPPCPDTR